MLLRSSVLIKNAFNPNCINHIFINKLIFANLEIYQGKTNGLKLKTGKIINSFSSLRSNFDDLSILNFINELLLKCVFIDEYKEVYNSVRKVTVDIEDEIEVNIELGINFEDDVLKDVFSNFISEIVLQDDQFNGFGSYSDSISHDEDVEDEYGNYVRTVDIPDEEWDVEYSYTVNTVGEQTIEITR